jgi:NADH-ubiquinone oxidoreductase chain 3
MRNLVQTYQEKYSVFECGFHSFIGQNRAPFNISFFIFALLYLLFDLEILLLFPYGVSVYSNGVYGFLAVLFFICVVSVGFSYEISKGSLKIDSRQTKKSKLSV